MAKERLKRQTHRKKAGIKSNSESLQNGSIHQPDQFEMIFDLVPTRIWYFDCQGKIIRVNNAVAQSLGMSVEQITGRSICELLPPEEGPRFLAGITEVVQSGVPKLGAIEEYTLSSLGKRTARTDKIPTYNEKGICTGIIALVNDITEQRKTEEALRETEELFNLFLEHNPIYVFFKDENIRSVRLSKNYENMLNMPLDRILGRTMDELFPSDLARSMVEDDLKVLRERKIVEVDEELNGRYYTTIKFPIVREGKPPLLAGFTMDITERKQVEEALRISRRQLQEAMDIASIVYWEADPVDDVFIFNDPFYAFYGTTAEQEGGYRMKKEEYVRRFVHPDDREIFFQTVKENDETVEREYTTTREHRIIRRDGEVRHILIRTKVVRDASGRVVERYGANQDITDLRRAEKEKANLEAQLFQVRKMEAIGTLSAGIAHDFNNILTALIGYASLLQMKTRDTILRTYTDQILSASQKATSLVQSLLAFSRQQNVNLRPVSLQNIIRKTGKLLERLVTEDITITTNLASEDIVVMADEIQIDQVLFNLAANARDAMPQGGILTIETKVVGLTDKFCRLHGFGTSGRYALLTVSDTGIGMDAATLERIFDPFFTTKEIGKGTGLGLSTVYGIVKQHNGYITVYSEPGKGTTLRVYLPLAETVPQEDDKYYPQQCSGIETILVAEDNDTVRNLIRDVLVEYGYTVIEAADGLDAIAKYGEGKGIDLVILDSIMPGKNGREVRDALVKINPDVRVIYTSGHTRDIFHDRGIDETFDFLQKPILPDALLQKVREVLDRGK